MSVIKGLVVAGGLVIASFGSMLLGYKAGISRATEEYDKQAKDKEIEELKEKLEKKSK